MSELIFLVEESQDGGYIAKALGASIYTESNTYEEIKEAIKDAVVCHYEDGSAPKIVRVHFVKEEVLAI